jgi:hypothetical protein
MLLPHMLLSLEEVDLGMLAMLEDPPMLDDPMFETLLGVAPREDCWPPPPSC